MYYLKKYYSLDFIWFTGNYEGWYGCQVGQTLSGTNHDEIEAAMTQTQMRMLMQQQRLRSARLEVIECLTEQQKIEAEMRALRSLPGCKRRPEHENGFTQRTL